jgi:hypothetical protein
MHLVLNDAPGARAPRRAPHFRMMILVNQPTQNMPDQYAEQICGTITRGISAGGDRHIRENDGKTITT